MLKTGYSTSSGIPASLAAITLWKFACRAGIPPSTTLQGYAHSAVLTFRFTSDPSGAASTNFTAGGLYLLSQVPQII